jgi:hypothetical protein
VPHSPATTGAPRGPNRGSAEKLFQLAWIEVALTFLPMRPTSKLPIDLVGGNKPFTLRDTSAGLSGKKRRVSSRAINRAIDEARELLAVDRDFSRFPALKTRNPL